MKCQTLKRIQGVKWVKCGRHISVEIILLCNRLGIPLSQWTLLCWHLSVSEIITWIGNWDLTQRSSLPKSNWYGSCVTESGLSLCIILHRSGVFDQDYFIRTKMYLFKAVDGLLSFWNDFEGHTLQSRSSLYSGECLKCGISLRVCHI